MALLGYSLVTASFHSDEEADDYEGRFIAIRMISFGPWGPGGRSHALLSMVISKMGLRTCLGRLCPPSSSPR